MASITILRTTYERLKDTTPVGMVFASLGTPVDKEHVAITLEEGTVNQLWHVRNEILAGGWDETLLYLLDNYQNQGRVL